MYSEEILKIRKYVYDKMFDFHEKGILYHNFDHVLDVLGRVDYLADSEGVGAENKELLQISALFHDIEYLQDPANHEYKSSITAEKFLLNINFPEDKIDIIKSIIRATKMDQKPTNILEQIISDADLDNMGREDFVQKCDIIKKEVENINNIKIEEKKRYQQTLSLMDNIVFYTSTQKKERDDVLEKNKKILEEKIKSL
ncbi:HD domain-containing protein [Candidatus Absconditicoccus praedator]|uniref:HD domain-containing protein n=1 Tax=Candidatus Absconditicoccus praedator TaxID=2735562 RepID=UPI001E447C10|nr:HD domain-containing protein [Candidatus Absconditicoccus praedator]UFX82821.1 HD domain-containing protein [Candidatus Absconditicoccus praedator]